MIRRLCITAALLHAFAVSAKSPEISQLDLATLSIPPLVEFTEDGFSGDLSPELVTQSKTLAVKFNYLAMNWARALKFNKLGTMDGVFPTMLTKERKKYLRYFHKPLGQATISVFFHQQNPKYARLEQRWRNEHFVVATMRGFARPEVLGLSNIDIVEVSSLDKAFQLWQLNRVDAVLGTREILLSLYSKQFAKEGYEILDLTKLPVYLAFSKQSAKANNLFELYPSYFLAD